MPGIRSTLTRTPVARPSQRRCCSASTLRWARAVLRQPIDDAVLHRLPRRSPPRPAPPVLNPEHVDLITARAYTKGEVPAPNEPSGSTTTVGGPTSFAFSPTGAALGKVTAGVAYQCSLWAAAEITGLTAGNVGFILHHAVKTLRDGMLRAGA